MYRIWLTTGEHRAVIAPQDRNTPAEVLELPTKTDRIHHFAWEPHVSTAAEPQLVTNRTLLSRI